MIPVEIGDLHNLIEIAMESNNISGPIPLTIFNISSLQTLSFTLNKLSGQIPAQVGRLANLQKLQLGGNRFKGMYFKSLFLFFLKLYIRESSTNPGRI